MPLFLIPPRALHVLRDAAAHVYHLAQLGLDHLCPCEEGHGATLAWITGADIPDTDPRDLCLCAVPVNLLDPDETCRAHPGTAA